jgi:hypothetical protein
MEGVVVDVVVDVVAEEDVVVVERWEEEVKKASFHRSLRKQTNCKFPRANAIVVEQLLRDSLSY